MGRQLSSRARDQMVVAAQELIAEVGLDGFTVDEVARRSGVAKTTIYRHFPSSAALAIHAVDCMIEEFPSIDTGSLRGDLESFFEVMRPHINDPATRQVLAGVFAMSAREPDFGEVMRQMLTERKAPLIRAFQRAIARGELSPETDLELAYDMLEGVFVFRRVLLDQTITPGESASVIDMILRAIRVES
ncbi:MAG: TetR/AcrR family transcriptional regulator [Acidimicrobiales bacterium]|nr:TetR/AcrR family transcriptional regulator [Acidimicrobiales bacterium]